MTYQDANLAHVENVGPIDRVNRMIVSLTLIVVAVAFTAISPAAVFSLVVVSIYAGLTAATGWDPLFVIVKAFSQRAPVQIPATASSSARPVEQLVPAGYKRAA